MLEENSFDLPLPAVVVGAQVKVNGGLMGMDESASGALTSIGLEDRCGIDYTLHMSKMFPDLLFGRPLILTVGVRNSKATNIGYTGFGGECQTTIEADVATLLTDRIAVGYEFRQKDNPYDVADGILNDEDDWHALVSEWLIFCDAVLVATEPRGEDSGVQKEIDQAREMGIPVYYSLEEIPDARRNSRPTN